MSDRTAEQIVAEALGPYGLVGGSRDHAARNVLGHLEAASLLVTGEITKERIEAATWALIDSDTDVVDRGVRDEHYRERRAEVERIAPIFTAAGIAPQEPSKCSNPQCPLDRSHSGPCAPEGWSPDREKLIAEADSWVSSARTRIPSDDAMDLIKRLRAALASPLIDEGKLAEAANETARGVFFDGNPFSHVEDAWRDGFTEGAHAVAVHLKEGK